MERRVRRVLGAFLSIALLFGSATPALAAISITSHTQGGGGWTSRSSVTWNETVSDASSVIVVCVGWRIVGGTTVSSVTYNGTGLTLGPSQANGTSQKVAEYYLTGPSTGTHSVVVTLSGSNNVLTSSTVFGGAKQTGQPNASGQGANSTGTLAPSLTTTDTTWLVGCENNFDSNITVGANTQALTQEDIELNTFAGTASAAADTPTLNYTWTGGRQSVYSLLAITQAASAVVVSVLPFPLVWW